MVIAVSDYLHDAFYLYMYIEEHIVYQTEMGRGEQDTLKLVLMFYKRRLHINKVESRMTDGQKETVRRTVKARVYIINNVIRIGS